MLWGNKRGAGLQPWRRTAEDPPNRSEKLIL